MTTYQPALNDRVTVVADDPSDNLVGTVVGQGTCVRTDDDPTTHHGYTRSGEFTTPLIILLDSEYRGWVQDTGDRRTYIAHMLVDPSNVEPAPWYVVVYELDRVQGGTEEGGWFYDTFDRVHWQEFTVEAEARAYAEACKEAYPEQGDRPLSSVLYNGGCFQVEVRNDKGAEHYPINTPTYE